MNLNHFKTHAYFGKILGGFFGYLVAGPVGTLLGVLIGNAFDKGLSAHLNNPYADLYGSKQGPIYPLFIQTTFETMAYIAKKDGRISEAEIQYANQTMQSLHLTKKQIEMAKEAFTRGKGKQFPIHTHLHHFKTAVGTTSDWMRIFLNIQYQAVMETSASSQKLHALNEVLQTLGFASMGSTYSSYEEGPRYRQHQASYTARPASLSGAYEMLGLEATATQAMVKKAYRKLISKHHPDKLIAQKKSEAEIKAANERTQKIRKAYEQICSAKGWQ